MNEPLIENEGGNPRSVLRGYLYIGLVLLINLMTLVLTQQTSSSSTLPQYTQNFVKSLVGACVCAAASIFKRNSLDLRGDVVPCLQFGVAAWFFQWGYTKCLIPLSPLQYTALDVGLGPIVSVLFGFVLLSERLALYKWSVMGRNIIVTYLILDIEGNLRVFSASSAMVSGLVWALVAFGGTSAMRTVQRTRMHIAPSKLTFWGYVLNTFLWFPPGCLPDVRIPFLWPALPADKFYHIAEVPATTWMALAICAMSGALVMIVQGLVLQHLDVGTYSIIIAPLILVSSAVYAAFAHPPGLPTCLGIFLAISGLAADFDRERMLKGPKEDQQDPKEDKQAMKGKQYSEQNLQGNAELVWESCREDGPEMGA